MHHFAYRDGVLHAEAVNLASLAQTVGTPFYCYSTATLERHGFKVERGVAVCGSGVGASVCANQIPGVRACLIGDHFSARQGVSEPLGRRTVAHLGAAGQAGPNRRCD
jgi:hypothetical protein